MGEYPRYLNPEHYMKDARERGVPLRRHRRDRVVVTGYAGRTAMGDMNETWDAMQRGETGVKTFGEGMNHYVSIAAPLPEDYDPIALLHPKERDRISRIAAMSAVTAREAGRNAGVLNDDGKLRDDIKGMHPYRVGAYIGSGIADTPRVIDIYNQVHAPTTEVVKELVDGKETIVRDENDKPVLRILRDDAGEVVIDIIANTRRLNLGLALSVFPEQICGDTMRLIEAQGPAGSTAEACATGAGNIAEAFRTIRDGEADVMFAGGWDDVLYAHPEVALAIFGTAASTLSRRNGEPTRANRPFDKDRDGFVAATGGGIVVLESLRHALKRGANILAEVDGFAKSNDGSHKTRLLSTRVADNIAQCLYDPKTKSLKMPDTILAHATSTKEGDKEEANALWRVFGKELADIDITAMKSWLGHLLGGAGAINVVAAIEAIRRGEIPYILNLENPDPNITNIGPFQFVQDKFLMRPVRSVLAPAYGFGGFATSLHLKEYVA